MSKHAIAEALTALKAESARLWKLSYEIVATDCMLEARSIAATLNEIADHIRAGVAALGSDL